MVREWVTCAKSDAKHAVGACCHMLRRRPALALVLLAPRLHAQRSNPSTRIQFREWKMGPGGQDGACASVGGNTGSYDEVWAGSEVGCANACLKSSRCIAYEYAVLKQGSTSTYTRCGAHSLLPPAPSHPQHSSCTADSSGTAYSSGTAAAATTAGCGLQGNRNPAPWRRFLYLARFLRLWTGGAVS